MSCIFTIAIGDQQTSLRTLADPGTDQETALRIAIQCLEAELADLRKCPAHRRSNAGARVPVVVDGRTEEQWCQEACRIGAYDYVEVVDGVKGRWIRTFTGERTSEKIEQSIKALKAQAERYDRTHGAGGCDAG